MSVIKMLMVSALTIVSLPLFAHDSTKQNPKVTKQKVVLTKYSCPMKCEGNKIYTKLGKCPKCGMGLKGQNNSNHKH